MEVSLQRLLGNVVPRKAVPQLRPRKKGREERPIAGRKKQGYAQHRASVVRMTSNRIPRKRRLRRSFL